MLRKACRSNASVFTIIGGDLMISAFYAKYQSLTFKNLGAFWS